VKADDEQKRIGAFSYHILKGLEGEASYGRGKVRGSMLGTYVTETSKLGIKILSLLAVRQEAANVLSPLASQLNCSST
jgi:hypothetical protein